MLNFMVLDVVEAVVRFS